MTSKIKDVVLYGIGMSIAFIIYVSAQMVLEETQSILLFLFFACILLICLWLLLSFEELRGKMLNARHY